MLERIFLVGVTAVFAAGCGGGDDPDDSTFPPGTVSLSAEVTPLISGKCGQCHTRSGSLDPDAIAQTYMNVLMQPRSAWTWEVEVRPWVERF